MLSRLGFDCRRAGQRADGRPARVPEGKADLDDHGPVMIEQRLSAALEVARRRRGVRTVGDLIERLSSFDSTAPVRSPDAIHLATARIFAQELDGLASYDERLIKAAAAAGLHVISPGADDGPGVTAQAR